MKNQLTNRRIKPAKPLTQVLFAFLAALFCHVTFAAKGPVQSLDSIKAFAKQYAEDQFAGTQGKLSIKSVRLDPRLRLAKCDQALEAANNFTNTRGGQLTVNVQCNGSKRWTLYVPVQVEVLQEVVVLNHSIQRKSIISAQDVRLEERDTNRIHNGFFTSLEDVIGKSIQRSIGNNLVLSPRHVQAPNLVKRGQKVVLIAKNQGFAVSMRGQAMSDGAAGDRIRVKNLSSERIIEGVITQDGQVATLM